MTKEECIFCKIANKKLNAEIIYESDNFIAVPDKNPTTKGHTLIIPKKHYVNLLDMPEMLGNELIGTIKRVAALRVKEGAEGFNIIINNCKAAGQVVMHLHVHLVPRKSCEKVKFPI